MFSIPTFLSIILLLSIPKAVLADEQREEELSREVKGLTEEQEELKQKHANTQKQLEETTKQLSETKNHQQVVTEKIKDLNDGLGTLVRKNHSLEQENKTYEGNIKGLQTQKEQLEQELKETNQKLQQMMQKSEELERSLSETTEHCKEVERVNLGIESEASKKIVQLQGIIIRYLEHQQRHMEMVDAKTREKLEATLKEVEQAKAKQQSLQESIETLNRSINFLTEQNADLNNTAASYKDRIITLEEENNLLEENLSATTQHKDALMKKEQELTDQISKVEGENISYQDRIRALEEEKALLEENFQAAAQQKNELMQKEQELIDQISKIESDYQEVQRLRTHVEAKAAQEIKQLRVTMQELHQHAEENSQSFGGKLFKTLALLTAGGLVGAGSYHWYAGGAVV